MLFHAISGGTALGGDTMVAPSHACSCLCLSSLVFHTSCVPKQVSETNGLTGLPLHGSEDSCAWKRSWPTSPVDPKKCCARELGSCKAAWDGSWDDPIHCMSPFDLQSLKAHGPNGNASPACAESCHRCVSCHQDPPDLPGISLFIAALAELCSLAHPSADAEKPREKLKPRPPRPPLKIQSLAEFQPRTQKSENSELEEVLRW